MTFAGHPSRGAIASQRTDLVRAMAKLGLSARAYSRILKLARTIADLDGAPGTLSAAQVAEAIQYRSLDRSFH
jgi:magnesium chelatase family protein